MSGSTLAKFVIFIFLACWADFCECLLALLPPKDVFMFLGLFPRVLHFFPTPSQKGLLIIAVLLCSKVELFLISTHFPVLFWSKGIKKGF